jgi:hypothetical protein
MFGNHVDNMTNSVFPKDGFSKAVAMTTLSILFLFMVSTPLLQVHAQKAGSIRIVTHVINQYGGTKQASDFSNCVDSSRGGSTSLSCSSGDENGGSESGFSPGPYKVTQDNPVVGYKVTYSDGCSGVIGAGEKKVCTVTYSDIPAQTQTTSTSSNNSTQ